MTRLLAIAFALFAVSTAQAQQKTTSAIKTDITNLFPSNGTGSITANQLRQVTNEIADSYANKGGDSFIGNVNLVSLLAGPGTTAPAYSANGFIASIRASNFTAESVYSAIYPGVTSYDALQGVVSLPLGSTVTQVNGVAGYVRGLAGASGGVRNSVALFGAGTAEVDNAAVWGTNTLLQDAATRTVGTGTGRILVGHEGDFNVMNPATEVHGFTVGGNSLATPAIANGYTANPLGTGIPWVTAFLSMDGAASNGMNLGALATSGTSVNSQKLQFSYFDSGSVKQTMVLQAQGGYLVLDAGGGGKNLVARGSGQFDNGVTIGPGTSYQINGANALTASKVSLPTSTTPASSSAACTTGDHAWDSGFVYVCVGTNTWKRAALTTW